LEKVKGESNMSQDADTKRSEDPKYSTEDSPMNTYAIPEKPQPNVPTTTQT